jgi:peptidyl-prolyl cis-trans isomerase B (cyclophilin B)
LIRRFLTTLAVVAAAVAISSCGSSAKTAKISAGATAGLTTLGTAPPITADATQNLVTMSTTVGVIEIRLDFANAPTGAGNFATLVKKGFYDGLTFHRAATDFVIQGGDPQGDGSGGPGYRVRGEVPKAGYKLGSVAMAKTAADPRGTSGSQFFIVTGSGGTTLPPDYAIVGQVTRGLDVAQKIESYAPASGDGPPINKVAITKATLSAS